METLLDTLVGHFH